MSALAVLTRALPLAATIGCAAPAHEPPIVSDAERIVGRAAFGGKLALLTTAPAIVTIEPATRSVSRFAARAADRSAPALWGLGEIDGSLYSLSGFNALVRLAPAGREAAVREVARLVRPLANLVDTSAGMAAQLAVGERGEPVAWSINRAGAMSALAGLARDSLGLSRAEESLLYLLSCSAPPLAVCWMPGSNQLFAFEGEQLRFVARLEAVQPLLPAAVLASPGTRAIRDVLRVGESRLAVLFDDKQSNPVAAEFDLDGRLVRLLAAPSPIRLFVAAQRDSILALARNGALIEVPR